MRGVPLTPEQVQKAAEVYERTGNYSEAARVIGVSEYAVRSRLTKLRESKRNELHVRACARGVRTARKAMTTDLATSAAYLAAHARDLEPRDFAELLKARAGTAKTLMAMQERAETAREAPLRRQKMRAEAVVAQKRADGTLPPEKHETTVTLAAAVTRIQELVHAARQRAGVGGPRVPDTN
jgi:hypothetical protein